MVFLNQISDSSWDLRFLSDEERRKLCLIWCIGDHNLPTALSYGKPGQVPHGVPRRVFCPLPWKPASLYHWTIVKTTCRIQYRLE
ncbi:hypothetical protein Lal_00021128 [Lupinus albus]|nr:hypothetical protein Lal_00021128 [Lupinus albus]